MIYRAQIAMDYGSAMPKDRVVITPHYSGPAGSGQALADALKTKLTNMSGVGVSVNFSVKTYDAQAPKPNYPKGQAYNTGGYIAVAMPRELALCLSYYAGINVPRFRGRVYIPAAVLSGSAAARPTAGQITAALAWGPLLFKSGGATALPTDIVPVVYSRVANAAYNLGAYWVDDEWDIMRSRGALGTTRQTGTIP